MPNTFELIASSTVGAGGASSIDFTSIPSTYTDLCLKVSTRWGNYGSWNWFYLTANSTTGSTRAVYGDGANAGSFTVSTNVRLDNVPGTGQTANTFASIDIYLPNYTSTVNKSVSIDLVGENNATTNYNTLIAGLIPLTSAITSLKLAADAGVNFAQYSTAYLYGVKNA